jgi:hypothetical protein
VTRGDGGVAAASWAQLGVVVLVLLLALPARRRRGAAAAADDDEAEVADAEVTAR